MTDAIWGDPSKTAPTRVIRRRYLIDPRRQLRTVIMTTTVAAVLMVVVNIGLAALRVNQSSFVSAAAPQLTPVLERQDLTFSWVTVLLTGCFVLAVMVRTIIETHRTAGAVFAVRQRLERVRDGDLQVSLKLRRDDNLQDLERPFNQMVAALRDRSRAEAERLEELAAAADALGRDGRGVAAGLRDLAASKMRFGG
jgi:methyl-accepting chemotaxis protein